MEVYVYADDVIRFHHPLVVRCLRWRRHNHRHSVCVQSDCKQVCALSWSASFVVELWVGNCRWRHQHKHTLPRQDLKVKSVRKSEWKLESIFVWNINVLLILVFISGTALWVGNRNALHAATHYWLRHSTCFHFRYGIVGGQQKCAACSYPLLTRSFYLFPCQHMFHSDCLIAEVS